MAINKGYIEGVGSRLENLQTACDLIGMTEIPFVSQAGDLASGVISWSMGDYAGAILSVAAILPVLGQAAGTMKMARRTKKVVDGSANKLLDITKRSEAPKQTPSVAKKSEVEAKPAKKEKVKEKEDNIITESDEKKHLDVMDNGAPPEKTLPLDEIIVENMSNSRVPPKIQSDFYQRYQEFAKYMENRKMNFNPTNLGKKPFGI